MSRFSGTAFADRGNGLKVPIPEATVYVYEWDYPTETTGALSALVDDDLLTSLPNPLTTDEFGEFYFNTDDGLKLLEYHYGGKLLYREQIILTPTGVYPGNDSTIRADLASDSGFTLIKYKSGLTGSFGRTAAQWARVGGADDGNVFDFIDPSLDSAIIARTNTADLKASFQAALDSGVGRVVVPSFSVGTIYKVSTSLTFPTQTELVGKGHWASLIRSEDLDSPILSSNATANCAVRNLSLAYNGTPLAGADAISLTNCQTWSFTDLWVPSSWNGLRLIGGGNHSIIGYRCYSYENTALLLEAAIDIQLNNFRFHAGDSIKGRQGGIRLSGGVEAFIASDGDVTLGKYGLTTVNTGSTARGSAPYFNRFAQVFLDSPLNEAALIDSASHLDMVGCWFGSAGHDEAVGYGSASDFAGVKLTNSSHVTIIGGAAYNNGGRGVNVDAASKFTRLIGLNLKRNGFTRGASTPGIEFAAGATDFAVTNNTFEKDADTTNYKMDVAVKVATGASDRYFISDNLLGGCTVSDGGTGTNKRVENNY
jgi:hypothetical protein